MNIVVYGACSAIAKAYCRLRACQGDSLYLIARNPEQLELLQQDCVARGAGKVEIEVADLADKKDLENTFNFVEKAVSNIDVLLVAHGLLPDQKSCEEHVSFAEASLLINLISPTRILDHFAKVMEQQGNGSIAAISSVAGDRGRSSNYHYGMAKGGLSIYLQGLRNRMSSKGISVLTIKPGFVDTPMTREFVKGPLWVNPDKIADDLSKGIENKKDIIYTPGFWRVIMLVIKYIPERIFKRLNL